MTRYHEPRCSRATGGRCTCGTPALSEAQWRMLTYAIRRRVQAHEMLGTWALVGEALVRRGYLMHVGDLRGRWRTYEITAAGRERVRQMEEGR